MKDRLGQSLEDYLEVIYLLSQSGKVVRVTDVAKQLKVKKPSVVAALKRLKERGLVEQERYGYIELTPEGAEIARKVFSRHSVLLKFLKDVLGVAPEVAQRDACVMEHYLSEESIERLKAFLKKSGVEL